MRLILWKWSWTGNGVESATTDSVSRKQTSSANNWDSNWELSRWINILIKGAKQRFPTRGTWKISRGTPHHHQFNNNPKKRSKQLTNAHWGLRDFYFFAWGTLAEKTLGTTGLKQGFLVNTTCMLLTGDTFNLLHLYEQYIYCEALEETCYTQMLHEPRFKNTVLWYAKYHLQTLKPSLIEKKYVT